MIDTTERGLERLLPESRAVPILRREGIEDAGEARRIITRTQS